MKIVEGMQEKSKIPRQHDDRSVVIYLKNLFFIYILYQRTRTLFFKIYRITYRYSYLCIIDVHSHACTQIYFLHNTMTFQHL